MNRTALKLFSSEEDALEFLEDYGLDEARVKVLEEFGRIPEAADIHAKNGDILKAVEMLTASAAHNVDHVRPAIELVLTGLRRDLTLDVLPTSNPIVPKLLRFANWLGKNVMMKQEVDEVSPSHPFHPFNRRVLYPITFSLPCTKRSNVLIMRVSARSPRLLLGPGMTLLLCCAWTMSSHPLSSCWVSRLSRFRHRFLFSLATFAC